MNSIEKDIELLEKYEIIDYSMLLIIEENDDIRSNSIFSNSLLYFGQFVANIRIVNFLQNFSTKKKIENKYNTLKKQKPENYSCMSTLLYKQLFLNMVKSIFRGV